MKKAQDLRKHLHGTTDRPLLEAALKEESPLLATLPADATRKLRMAPEGDSEEHRAVAAGAASANRLLAGETYQKTFAAMVVARQLYVLAYRALQELLLAEAEGSLAPMTEDLFVGAAMHKAAQPFSEHVLVHGLVENVLPWLAQVVDAHSDADEREIADERAAAETARRSLPIPLGFDHTGAVAETPQTALGRDRALVLVGWGPALLWLATQVIEGCVPEDLVVLRLCDRAPSVPSSSRLGNLGRSQWEGCANSARTLSAFEALSVPKVLSTAPDLVVCDDLTLGFTCGFLGRPGPANAGDAHKRLSRWAHDTAGAALLGLIPLPDQDPVDVRTPVFEQLRAFSHLRFVAVEPREDHYRITVGAGATIEAPRAAVDSGPSLIIH